MDGGMNQNDHDHWLVRPATIRALWWGGSIVLALTVLAQFVIPVKGYFTIDSWPAFGAIFGFISCLLMVLFSRLLGLVLKRKEDYYADSETEDDA
jgi:hypothetical protein